MTTLQEQCERGSIARTVSVSEAKRIMMLEGWRQKTIEMLFVGGPPKDSVFCGKYLLEIK